MQISHEMELFGLLSAIAVWGGIAVMTLLPNIRRQLAVVSLHAKRTPFRAILGAVAVGVAIAYGGSKPSPEPTQVVVTFDARGGECGEESRQVTKGEPVGELPTATRAGYDFSGWFTAAEGGEEVTAATVVEADTTVFAQWTAKEYAIEYELGGGVNAEGNPTNYTVESGRIELAPATRAGYEFTGWTPDGGVIAAGSTGNRTFTASWREVVPDKLVVTFDARGGECAEASRQVPKGEPVGELPTATRTGYDFSGWFTSAEGGEKVTAATVVEADTTVFAQWTAGPLVGRYLKLDLVADLNIEIPTNVNYAAGDKVTVKVEGLAKGLKVVTTQLKAADKKAVTNVIYTIEGVPTEAIDFESRPMYARVTVTYKDKTMGDKGKAESLQPIALSIMMPEPYKLTSGVIGQEYGPLDITNLWSEVGTSREWSFKGWPAGLKYRDGKLSGKPTKAGEFPITATWKHKIDGKSVSETFSAVLTVWGDDGARSFRYTAQQYGAAVYETIADAKSVSGLPTGLKFDKTTGMVTGTPTKAGVFAVTVTKTDNTKETFLWKVAPAAAPTFALDTGTAPVEDLKAQIVQGANQSFAIEATAGAKVTVSGLPSGLKLVQDKKTGLYSVEGVATKPGEYFVTFKTVLNKVTTVTTTAFTVKGNPFAATYCGYLTARPAAEATKRLAIAEVTVAAAGTVKLTYTEGKTKYTASVKSFDWNDTTGWGKAEGLVLKASSADKQLGYGDRKATVAFNVRGSVLYASLYLTDAKDTMLMPWAWDLYATVKATEVPLPASQTFVFRTEDGADTNALATVSVAYDAKKATAAFSGKLYDGTAVKATVPVLRQDEDGTSDDYVFAPFLVIAKDGTIYRFDRFSSEEDGGCIDWVSDDGEVVEEAWSAPAEYTLGDKKFAELVPETGVFTFGWGSDATDVGESTESFAFEVTTDANGNPKGVAIYDADAEEGEKPLATVTAKVGKLTGAISVSFTSKKGDKAKYAVELVWRGDKLFAGHVTRTWKDGKVSCTAYGTAEVMARAE